MFRHWQPVAVGPLATCQAVPNAERHVLKSETFVELNERRVSGREQRGQSAVYRS